MINDDHAKEEHVKENSEEYTNIHAAAAAVGGH
jgi:hypothetical protein